MSAPDVRLPLFPLGSVLFPGQSIPLRVFEPRYRAMVRDLLAVDDPTQRLFGSVAIREGYEVGAHGVQSLYRVGCTVQLTDVDAVAAGGYEVVGVVRGRFRLDGLETAGEYAVARATLLDEAPSVDDERIRTLTRRAVTRFARWRGEVARWREDDGFEGTLPRDPQYLAWTLSSVLPLPLPDRQALLEAVDVGTRLGLIDELLDGELRAMAAIPSLPATEVARTRWSPN